MSEQLGSAQRPVRAAIIGAGPSGFYAAGSLLHQKDYQVTVDMFDRLPAPFGLVRYGVAPDHQKIKSVTKIYERTAADPAFPLFWQCRLWHGHYPDRSTRILRPDRLCRRRTVRPPSGDSGRGLGAEPIRHRVRRMVQRAS